MSRLEEIRTAVEQAKGEEWSDCCFNDHYPFVSDCEYLLDELAGSFPKTWSGLMDFVDHYYPRDIFTESDDQPGSRIVWLLRQLATLEARVERAKAFSETTRNDHGFDCVAAKPLLAILEGDTE